MRQEIVSNEVLEQMNEIVVTSWEKSYMGITLVVFGWLGLQVHLDETEAFVEPQVEDHPRLGAGVEAVRVTPTMK